ncbi:MAG TPA: mechanosensitive ion channel family protein [Solirubrobacterales bacterium]|nr:mechanosensitive ion channel family protein [Solirubrobacterales bacterium]
MPAPRRPRLPRELFETRTHAWTSLGLGEEIETQKVSKRTVVGLVVAVAALVATLVVYSHRRQIAPGYGEWFRVGTVLVLILVGSAAIHWLLRSVQPRLNRRLDPATAGTTGFVFRLLASLTIVVVALRVAGVTASTLAVGGAFTAVLLGLAAQQSLGAIFAGVVLQSTRPFRVGERVRLVGGPLAGQLEGTVTSLGLFYTTLSQGADRLLVPNNVLLMLAVVPLREPEKVDVRVRFPRQASPRDVEQQLLRTITVPTRYRPSVSLEEIEPDSVIMRISATPLRSEDGSQLAEEVLEALQRHDTAEHEAAGTTPLPD